MNERSTIGEIVSELVVRLVEAEKRIEELERKMTKRENHQEVYVGG